MKAHMPNKRKNYTEEITDHLLKIACVVLINEHHFGHDRLADFLGKISEYSDELLKNPYLWIRIDEQLIDKRNLPFERESLDERELSAKVARRIK